MRRLSFEPDRFSPPDGEQFLELAIASLTDHDSFADFVKSCSPDCQTSQPPAPWESWPNIRGNVLWFANLELARPHLCRIEVINDEWDDLEVAIESGTDRVWYHWWTTA